MKHITKDGKSINIRDMGDTHLLNTIKYYKRKAKEGVVIEYGGGNCLEDIWYDKEVVYNEEAELLLNLQYYIDEKTKRNL